MTPPIRVYGFLTELVAVSLISDRNLRNQTRLPDVADCGGYLCRQLESKVFSVLKFRFTSNSSQRGVFKPKIRSYIVSGSVVTEELVPGDFGEKPQPIW